MKKDEILQLQWLIAQGDERAYRRLFAYFYPKLRRFAATFVKDEMSAEEIVADVFVHIWEHREKLQQIRVLPVYLYTAVKNRSLNYLAYRSRDIIAFVEEYPADLNITDLNPERLLMTREMAGKISEAISLLPPKCKLVYKMVREHQLKYREVADILNISEHTVDAQMTNAIKRITQTISLYVTIRPKKNN